MACRSFTCYDMSDVGSCTTNPITVSNIQDGSGIEFLSTLQGFATSGGTVAQNLPEQPLSLTPSLTLSSILTLPDFLPSDPFGVQELSYLPQISADQNDEYLNK